jgi:O-acetyl-ADP-ribose deacetylase (regulator of RNase III)
MAVRYVIGNALEAEEGLILHGVNCQKAMNSGIAKQIREKWPEVYLTFLDTKPKLGEVTFINVGTNLYVGNCYTQEYYGRNKTRVYVDYEAVSNALYLATNFASAMLLDIHMPWIGCGLANGSREIIKDIIESKGHICDITVYEYNI